MSSPSNPDSDSFRSRRQRYEQELFERVLPFWQHRAADPAHGGYFACLDRDGTVYDTTKYAWLIGRQAWMFSTLYETVEQRLDWLETARAGVAFLRTHAVRDDGRVYFSLDRTGRPVYLQRKIFSECFYAMALAAYARIADREDLRREAVATFERVWTWSHDPALVGRPALPGQPSSRALAVPMILLNVIEILAGDDRRALARYTREAESCVRRVRLHLREESGLLYEHVAPDGAPLEGSAGRLLNPGHAIEAGWFLLHWSRLLNRPDWQQLGIAVIRANHERGWDDTHGGLFYFLDAAGYSPVQLEWSMKLWWPHTEALYAHLLAFQLTGASSDLARFEQTESYLWEHFVDPEHSGWWGYCDRQGTRTHRFKGGPYKGCFHVPRSLLFCRNILATTD